MLRLRTVLAVTAALGLLAGACSQPAPAPSPPADPSAEAPIEPPLADALPAPVQATFDRLVAAAAAGDDAALAAIAAESPDFHFSFGPDTDFAAVLTAEREAGLDPAGDLATILALPWARQDVAGDVYFVWPYFFVLEPEDFTEAARADAALIIGAEAAAQIGPDSPYLGRRTAIDADGEWTYFVAGD